MADAVERITNLVALLLETRAPLTADQIATELRGQYPAGAAALRGAFERDKALLREIGVPLEQEVLAGADAGRTAYWIDRRRYELADLDLADDERAALELAVAAARLADAQFGLLKLGAEGRGAAPVVANVPELSALPPLRDATARHCEVAFAYRGSPRRLHPYALLLRQGFWYVIGHDVDRAEERTYRVDRIEGDVSVGPDGAFERPEGFDPRDAFPSDPRLLGEEPAATATVAVDASHAAAVRRDLGLPAGDQPADVGGRVVVEVPCANVYAFASWQFGWGDAVEVLAPPDVRGFVTDWLRRTAAAGRAS